MKLSRKVVLKIYESYMKGRSFSEKTIIRYIYEVDRFFKWVKEKKEKIDLRDVTDRDLKDYWEYLQEEKHPVKGQKFTVETRQAMVTILKSLFRYLSRNNYILQNPFDLVDFSRRRRLKMREALSEENVNRLLESIEPADTFSIRDRCLFELLYCTGLRGHEACWLNITDVNIKEGKLFVRKGKGKRERLIPIGKNAAFWLKQYMQNSRNELVERIRSMEDMSALFITGGGKRMTSNTLAKIFRGRVREAGMKELKISPHVLRHSFATHMIENGADILDVKNLLGHSSIQSTVIYTHFTVKSLKKLIKRYHPRENELYEDLEVDEKFFDALQK